MAELLDQGVETPAGDVPIIPVSLMVVGAYLAWFGVYYWGSDTRWPTDPLKAVLQGQGIPVPDRSARQDALTNLAGAWNTNAAKALGGGADAVANAVGSQVAAGGGGGAPAGAQTLDHGQLQQLWTSNGGDPGKANLAAAIAQAESSGRTWITSPNPDGGTNVGLWQLDTKGEGSGHTVTELQDPATNARVTILRTSNGTRWSAWQTWKDGTYKQFLA